ncbi:hypothetical protein N7492_000490 [Penicillium capsulatum]|uniref:Uncharacterized protein n=1 Tax=Penicillium capsulatum TaxID=69766 RepID=A0A9W9LZG0_9EURO|nr:hypothetical protein N7492_000490 [Penicillium capsulatum]
MATQPHMPMRQPIPAQEAMRMPPSPTRGDNGNGTDSPSRVYEEEYDPTTGGRRQQIYGQNVNFPRDFF